jgi:hypothetical protein
MNLEEIDGALWGLTFKDNEFELETTVYRFTDKITPYANAELGIHKYHILTFRHDGEPETIEFMKANIGDVRRFIDNYAKAGYNGVMVKDGCIPKKTIKDIIRVTFRNWSLPEKFLKAILSQV